MRKRALFLLPFLIFLLFGCSAQQKSLKETEQAVSADKYPKTVAVLPFANETDEIGISGQVRKSFYNHFSSKPFRDIELNIIDAKTAKAEKASGKSVSEIPPKEIADSVGADGLIYGKITDFKKVYAVAYSQIGVEAEVWMVNARTGEELWRIKEAVRYHEGGIPLSPVGAVMTVVSTAMNIRDIQQIRVINELGWKLNEKIPVPEGLKLEEKPVIKNAITNAKEGPFGKGRIIKAALEGDKGMIGLFEIPGLKNPVAMKEVSPGEYLGEYMVVPGDNVKEAPVVIYLKRPNGEETEWHDISGLVTVDTTPPPPVAELKGRAFIERIELNWKGVAAPDLKGYRILRSKKPLSDYAEAGFTEEPKFTDTSLDPKEGYFYRVESVDTAGNSSEAAETVRLALREKELKSLPALIDKDTVLYSGGYLVKDTVTVADNVTLTIEPDSKIFFEKGASLKVLGNLAAEGEKDQWIEFLPKTPEERLKGLAIEGGVSKIKYARFSGAEKAISIKNSETSISNTVIEYNGTGLIIEGVPSPKITETTIWHNNEGVRIENTRALLSRNEITQNRVGVLAVDSSPETIENNIFGNETNIEVKGAPFQIDRNYLGSINISGMKIKGAAKIAKTLSEPYPNGKLVDAVEDPYALLTPEERKTKLTELLITAGKSFKERNFGRAASTFEEALKIEESSATYYYLALSYQGMDENEKALGYLKKGVEKYPMDSGLMKAYGLLLYQLDQQTPAREALKEGLRLNPGDKQIRFILERLEGK